MHRWAIPGIALASLLIVAGCTSEQADLMPPPERLAAPRLTSPRFVRLPPIAETTPAPPATDDEKPSKQSGPDHDVAATAKCTTKKHRKHAAPCDDQTIVEKGASDQVVAIEPPPQPAPAPTTPPMTQAAGTASAVSPASVVSPASTASRSMPPVLAAPTPVPAAPPTQLAKLEEPPAVLSAPPPSLPQASQPAPLATAPLGVPPANPATPFAPPALAAMPVPPVTDQNAAQSDSNQKKVALAYRSCITSQAEAQATASKDSASDVALAAVAACGHYEQGLTTALNSVGFDVFRRLVTSDAVRRVIRLRAMASTPPNVATMPVKPDDGT
jgi:hypothetical protein